MYIYTACFLDAASITPDNAPAQIARSAHTLFNVVTTIILIPFGGVLAAFSEKLLKDKPEDDKSVFTVHFQYKKYK